MDFRSSLYYCCFHLAGTGSTDRKKSKKNELTAASCLDFSISILYSLIMEKKQQHHQKKEKHHAKQKIQKPQLPDTYPVENEAYFNDVITFLEWHAPGRPFKYRSREYFINGFLIMIALEIILFLFSQYLLMVVVFSLVFLSFALSSVPPKSFHYKITSEGVLVENSFFIWEELYDFYFMKYHGQKALHIRTKTLFPGEIILTLGELTPQQIKEVLLHFLPFREHVEPGFIKKAGDWLERTFPLEKSQR